MKEKSLTVNRESFTVDKNFMFDFEKLEVYQVAMDFADEVFEITSKLPWKYQSSLGDNFRRSALSIVSNIAEGSGKISNREKKHYYKIALTSDRECIPMITLLKRRKIISEQAHWHLREICIRISSMLIKLEQSVNGIDVGTGGKRLTVNGKRN
uniref:Four helix bundle protein n=1 Tax=candidate division WOR-3 bacterium TaxID=2052148 RepID=A0A7V0Z5N7_UNCW3